LRSGAALPRVRQGAPQLPAMTRRCTGPVQALGRRVPQSPDFRHRWRWHGSCLSCPDTGEHREAGMDHRHGERCSVDVTVLIRKRAWRGWVIGRMRNLSVSGAWVELPRDALSVLSQVRLELEVPCHGRHRVVHCNAMVVRTGCGGVGLAFEEMAPKALSPWWRGIALKTALLPSSAISAG